MSYRLLLVEDDAPQRRTLAGFLRKRGYLLEEAGSAAEAMQVAVPFKPELLLTDLRLGGPDGVALLEQLRPQFPDLQALVISAYGTVDDAVRAMRAGAYDVMAKPVDLDRLVVLIDKALERGRLTQENRGLRAVAQASGPMGDAIGDSEAMRRVKDLALRVAPANSSVLLLGETGTGKEVMARAIHRSSGRRDKAFITVNCAALPDNLIESELFGYEKGAFTGASEARPGRFERADGGTLFLDEVGDIPLSAQVKLLNVLQTGRLERLGGQQEISVDVRLIAATHRDLESAVRAGAFREDLYYRINVVAIELPPLRARGGDISALAEHFLHKYADIAPHKVSGFEPAALQALSTYAFPGNVRQLENWIERAVVLAQTEHLGIEDFPPQLSSKGADAKPLNSSQLEISDAPDLRGLDDQLAELEQQLLRQALDQHQGNKSAAARQLKIGERGLRYKMQKYGMV